MVDNSTKCLSPSATGVLYWTGKRTHVAGGMDNQMSKQARAAVAVAQRRETIWSELFWIEAL